MTRTAKAPPDRTVEGVGLHRGAPARVTLRPGATGAGLRLRRIDGGPAPWTTVGPQSLTLGDRRTVLDAGGRRVETTEHLLAALAGLERWDADIEVHGPEIPILDGSAEPWARLIAAWPIAARKRPLVVEERIEIRRGAREAIAEPSDGLEIRCEIEFAHPAVGRQGATWTGDPDAFQRNLAPARTFGFAHELEALRERGLIAGGSLDNALVFDHEGPVNTPRFPDEPVRHKLLDAIGDLALLGRPLRAKVTLRRPGHALVGELMRAIAAGHRGR